MDETKELRLCPFCGCSLEPFGHELDRHVNPPVAVENFHHPYNEENPCPLSLQVHTARRWNTRPIEDALRAENERQYAGLTEQVNRLTAENARLQSRNATLTALDITTEPTINTLRARAEQAEQDAERLYQHCCYMRDMVNVPVESLAKINADLETHEALKDPAQP